MTHYSFYFCAKITRTHMTPKTIFWRIKTMRDILVRIIKGIIITVTVSIVSNRLIQLIETKLDEEKEIEEKILEEA